MNLRQAQDEIAPDLQSSSSVIPRPDRGIQVPENMDSRLRGGQEGDLYSGLKQWQREVLFARLLVLRNIDDYRKATGLSLHRSIKAFLASISNGGPANLKRAADIANHRKGENRTLTDKTIYRWYNMRQAEGDIGLVPADKETMSGEIPLWFPGFLEAYRQPSKPSIAEALRYMGSDAPPYHQVIRALKKFSNLDLHRGRMSGSELRAIRAYTKRDFSDLLPMDIIVADGHSYKAYVSHPVHGRRFLPEVEAIVDVATRACIGWSTGLAESALIVADALRHAATVSDAKPMGGLFAILYTDNGAGNRAKMNSHEVTGIVSRLGGTIKFGIAGNPQGRGVIERLNQSLWIPSARKLLTYNGKDMDQLTLRKRLKIVDKDLKERGSSQHLLSWPQFIEFLAAEVEAYNNRPHSSLPNHMTPAERWQQFVAQGWQPDTLNLDEMRDLFRPQVQCITRRGLVTVFGNEYFNSELEHHHGETAYVNYDIHDWRVVWVRDKQQRLICEAHWNANRRAFYPMSVVEQAREKRKERRLALKREQIREIEEEASSVIPAQAGIHVSEAQIPDECVQLAEELASPPRTPSEETEESSFAAPQAAAPTSSGQADAMSAISADSPSPSSPPLKGGEMSGASPVGESPFLIPSPLAGEGEGEGEKAGQSSPDGAGCARENRPALTAEEGDCRVAVAPRNDVIASEAKQSRPLFSDEIERYEWHLRNGFREDEDLMFKREFERSESYRMLYEAEAQ